MQSASAVHNGIASLPGVQYTRGLYGRRRSKRATEQVEMRVLLDWQVGQKSGRGPESGTCMSHQSKSKCGLEAVWEMGVGLAGLRLGVWSLETRRQRETKTEPPTTVRDEYTK